MKDTKKTWKKANRRMSNKELRMMKWQSDPTVAQAFSLRPYGRP